MRGRSGGLTLALLMAWTTPAFAHRLDAEAHARPFGMVLVESWFETGQKPHGARVEIRTTDGRLLSEAALPDDGTGMFAVPGTDALRVVVYAGGGHRAEATVSAEERAQCAATTQQVRTWLACVTPIPSPFIVAPLLVPMERSVPVDEPMPTSAPHGGTQWSHLAIGVGLLLGVAAVVKARQRKNKGSG
jgi:nickel transport protein